MSLNDLTKEQKQYAALGLLAASIVVILMVLGIRFSMATVSAAKEELDDISGKINKANRALSRSRQTSEDYVETAAVLGNYLKNAPPERNYYSWATEVIYSTARFADLEIDSIDEISIPRQQLAGSDAPAGISFESYSLRIVAHGGYENTKYFLNLLHQDYPLVRFSGVEISSGQNQDKHNVQLFVQWPFNFGAISKNWDALASRKIKVAVSSGDAETAALVESEPEDKPAISEVSLTKSDPVREPHPPTTRPEEKEPTVSEPTVEPIISKTPAGLEVESPGTPTSGEAESISPAEAELKASLLSVAPSGAEMMDAEPQYTDAVSEPPADPIAEQELETVADKPDAVMEPEIVSNPDPESMIEEEAELPPINVVETSDPTPVSDEAPFDTMVDAESQFDAPSVLEGDAAPEAFGGPQPEPVSDETHSDVTTDITENNPEELTNEESGEEAVSMSSLLEDMMGVNNEK